VTSQLAASMKCRKCQGCFKFVALLTMVLNVLKLLRVETSQLAPSIIQGCIKLG